MSKTGEQVWGRWHSPKMSVLGDCLMMLKLPSFKGHWEALRKKPLGGTVRLCCPKSPPAMLSQQTGTLQLNLVVKEQLQSEWLTSVIT